MADLDDLAEHLSGAPGASVEQGGVRDVLARVAWLGDVLPELAAVEVDLLVDPAGRPVARGVRVRVAPPVAAMIWVRDLPL